MEPRLFFELEAEHLNLRVRKAETKPVHVLASSRRQ
jgi:hypothetical protein